MKMNENIFKNESEKWGVVVWQANETVMKPEGTPEELQKTIGGIIYWPNSWK